MYKIKSVYIRIVVAIVALLVIEPIAEKAEVSITFKTEIPYSSSGGTGLAYLDGKLYVVWRHINDDMLNFMYSTDNGKTFTNKITIIETSSAAPCIVAHNNAIYFSWIGIDDHKINIGWFTKWNSKGYQKITLGESSDDGASLASVGNTLYMSWKGYGNSALNFMESTDNGIKWINKITFNNTCSTGPSLAYYNGGGASSLNKLLYVAWGGIDRKLNWGYFAYANPINLTSVHFYNNGEAPNISPSIGKSPSIAVVNGFMYIAYRANSDYSLHILYPYNNTTPTLTMSTSEVLPETSKEGINLLSVGNNELFMDWTGTDTYNKINVAGLKVPY
jgi:hypothetical protein